MTPETISINEAFDPDDPTARFVVSMAMARNDVLFTLIELVEANERGAPFRVWKLRVLLGYLHEALLALSQFRNEYEDVRALIRQLPTETQENLGDAVRLDSSISKKALSAGRNSVFHYPAPSKRYDESLEEVLVRAMGDYGWAPLRTNPAARKGHEFFAFADELATAVALREFSHELVEHRVEQEQVRQAAIGFANWSFALVHHHLRGSGIDFTSDGTAVR